MLASWGILSSFLLVSCSVAWKAVAWSIVRTWGLVGEEGVEVGSGSNRVPHVRGLANDLCGMIGIEGMMNVRNGVLVDGECGG